MSLPDTVCGVLLVEEAYSLIGDAIAPYLKEGKIGKFIYCSQAAQNGNFVDMTFEPSQTDGSVTNRMVISIPVHFIKFMAKGAGSKSLPIGFSSPQ
jgi:hypothetical protein